jgi:glycosyltransferase involved in cell wall biosynthesis
MSDALTVGALITYHDERELLSACLASLGSQTRAPDEILVYDDASVAPAEEFVPPGLRVRVIRGAENRGPAHARNILVQACQSTYVHFHDADDVFSSEWCARVRGAIEQTGADVVFTEASSFDSDGPRIARVLGLHRLAAGEDLVRFCLQGAMLAPAGTYRRPIVLAMGGYRTHLWQSEDFDFHVRLAATGVRYAIVPDPLVHIRVRPDGRSQNQVEVWESAIQAVTNLADELPATYQPDLAAAAARAGSVLFKLGARSQASLAFRLATRLGPPGFQSERRLYRYAARMLGLELVERLAMVYRSILPRGIRIYLATRGW